MNQTIARIMIATALILAPAAAFAHPTTGPRPHTDHTPVVHPKTIEPHK